MSSWRKVWVVVFFCVSFYEVERVGIVVREVKEGTFFDESFVMDSKKGIEKRELRNVRVVKSLTDCRLLDCGSKVVEEWTFFLNSS